MAVPPPYGLPPAHLMIDGSPIEIPSNPSASQVLIWDGSALEWRLVKISDLASMTLAQLNAQISDADVDDSSSSRPPNGAAGGDLSGTYPDPTIASIARSLVLPRTAAVAISGTRAASSSTAAGDHVEFDLSGGKLFDDGLVELSTGVGQLGGIVTLKAGHAYRILGLFFGDVVNGGSRQVRLRHSDNTDLDDISRTGAVATGIIVTDTDVANIRIAHGNTTGVETGVLASDSDVAMVFVSSFDVVREGTRLFITEIA